MTTIVAFLRARLVEEETIAFAAISDRYQWVEDPHLPRENVDVLHGLTGQRTGVQFRHPRHLETVARDDGAWRATYGRVYGVTLDTHDEGGITKDQAKHIALHDPARVLREIEARRRILDDYNHLEQLPEWDDRVRGGKPSLERVLRSFALVHVDHPDYDQAWRS